MKLRLPGVLLLLAVVWAVPVWATEPSQEGYTLRSEDGLHGVPATLVGPDGKEVASFDTLYAAHNHPYEVRPGRVFWVSRPPRLSEGWTDSLRVTELATGKTRTLFSKPGLEFRTDAEGHTAAVVGCDDEGSCTLSLVDVATGKTRIAYTSSGKRLYPLALSREGRRVWFGQADGPAGEWEQLALYENGKTRFFPIRETEDLAIDVEGSRVAYALPCTSNDCERERRKRGGEVLVVEDLSLGTGRLTVARKKHGAFKPKWNPDGALTYVDAQGREARFDPAEANSKRIKKKHGDKHEAP